MSIIFKMHSKFSGHCYLYIPYPVSSPFVNHPSVHSLMPLLTITAHGFRESASILSSGGGCEQRRDNSSNAGTVVQESRPKTVSIWQIPGLKG